MAKDKPSKVNTLGIDECVFINSESDHWFDHHMPCWICHTDNDDDRKELMWNDECKTYFHASCLINR